MVIWWWGHYDSYVLQCYCYWWWWTSNEDGGKGIKNEYYLPLWLMSLELFSSSSSSFSFLQHNFYLSLLSLDLWMSSHSCACCSFQRHGDWQSVSQISTRKLRQISAFHHTRRATACKALEVTCCEGEEKEEGEWKWLKCTKEFFAVSILLVKMFKIDQQFSMNKFIPFYFLKKIEFLSVVQRLWLMCRWTGRTNI